MWPIANLQKQNHGKSLVLSNNLNKSGWDDKVPLVKLEDILSKEIYNLKCANLELEQKFLMLLKLKTGIMFGNEEHINNCANMTDEKEIDLKVDNDEISDDEFQQKLNLCAMSSNESTTTHRCSLPSMPNTKGRKIKFHESVYDPSEYNAKEIEEEKIINEACANSKKKNNQALLVEISNIGEQLLSELDSKFKRYGNYGFLAFQEDEEKKLKIRLSKIAKYLDTINKDEKILNETKEFIAKHVAMIENTAYKALYTAERIKNCKPRAILSITENVNTHHIAK